MDDYLAAAPALAAPSRPPQRTMSAREALAPSRPQRSLSAKEGLDPSRPLQRTLSAKEALATRKKKQEEEAAAAAAAAAVKEPIEEPSEEEVAFLLSEMAKLKAEAAQAAELRAQVAALRADAARATELQAQVVRLQLQGSQSPDPPKDAADHDGVQKATGWMHLPAIQYAPANRFTVGQIVIGEGGQGRVHKGQDTFTGTTVAIKLIDTQQVPKDTIEREVAILAYLHHPRVIGLNGLWFESQTAFLALELGGPDLFNQTIDLGFMPEGSACGLLAEMVQALQHCHTMGVAHRDVKLENILADRPSGGVKLCDFGLSHVFARRADGSVAETPLQGACGSRSYMAPELWATAPYDGFAADCWSLGICLFALLAGFFPLDQARGGPDGDWRFDWLVSAQAEKASSTHTIFHFCSRPCSLSAKVVHLLDGLLCIDPTERLTLPQVLAHPWLQSGASTVAGTEDGEDAPVYRVPRALAAQGLGQESSVAASIQNQGPPPALVRQKAQPAHV